MDALILVDLQSDFLPGGALPVPEGDEVIPLAKPGIQQVRRFRLGQEFMADVIYDTHIGVDDGCTLVDPTDMTRRKAIAAGSEYEDLLVPVFRKGQRVYAPPAIDDIRERAARQLARFHPGIKRFANPHEYPVGLEKKLFDLKTEHILRARGVVR